VRRSGKIGITDLYLFENYDSAAQQTLRLERARCQKAGEIHGRGAAAGGVVSGGESWNERMWSDGEPIDPSPTIDQAVNGGFPWLEIQCARCKTPSDVDLAAMKQPLRVKAPNTS
jgi:hypothetical protein